MFDRGLFDKQQFDKQAGSAVGLYAVLGGVSSLEIDPYLCTRASLPGHDTPMQGSLEVQALYLRVPVGTADFSMGPAFDYTAELPNTRAELPPPEIPIEGDIEAEVAARAFFSAETGAGGGLSVDYLSQCVPLGPVDIGSAQGGFEVQQVNGRLPLGAIDFALGLAFDHTSEFSSARLMLQPAATAMGGGLAAVFVTRVSIIADIGMGAEACVTDYLCAGVPVGRTDFDLAAQLDAPAKSRLPLGSACFAMGAALSINYLGVRVSLSKLVLGGRGTIVPSSIARLGSEKLILEGIDLAPGDELVIDTDTVEIFINGLEDVTKDAYNSEFFQLLPGDNQLVFRDSESSRTLKVSAIMSARWL